MVAMVGRDQELAAVLHCLTSPEAALILVMGEAGIGKSRLVSETVIATPERLTLVGACLPMHRVLPLLPLVDALDTGDQAVRRELARALSSLSGPLRPHLAGVMPRTFPEEIAPPQEISRDRLFLATEALLSRLAEQRPVTLVVEDVHWADSDTLDLLTYLAGARHSTDLSVLVTFRSDETQMPEPVAAWLHAQRRSALVHELVLGPLDPGEVRRMVDALPHPDSVDIDNLSAQVFARGEGNPFFTEQLLASMAGGDRLPTRLAKLLSARVRDVSPSAQEAVTALAVLARPVPIGAVRLVTMQEEEICLSAVRELESASLIVRDGRGVRTRHALLNEALIAELPGLPAAYHRRVAAALESLDDPSTIPEITDHLHQAGDELSELRMAQLAGQRAWALGAYADAALWYKRVTDLHSRHPDEPLLLAEPEMFRRTIRALDLSGALRDAIAMAERAASDFTERGKDSEPGLRLLSYRAQLLGIHDIRRGQGLLEDLLPLYRELPPSGDHAALLNRLSSAHQGLGDGRQALLIAKQGLAVARAAGDIEQEAQTLARISACYRRLGDRAAADHSIESAIRAAERSGDGQTMLFTLVNETDNRLKYAEYDVAVRSGEKGIEIAHRVELHHSFHAQLLVANTAEAYLALGDTKELARLVDAYRDHPLRREDDVLSGLRAHADLRRGDPSGALALLRSERGIRSQGAQWTREDAETLGYVLLWNHQPAKAFNVITSSLPEASVGDHSQEAGYLLSLGARVAADLAEQGEALSSEVIAKLDRLREAMACDPFEDRSTLPRSSADRRQWQAEGTRCDGGSDPKAWAEAAAAWASLSMPHDAAYCWWRAAQAHLASGASKTGVQAALQSAHRLSVGHLPLRDEIAKTAMAARLPILEALSADGDVAFERGLTAQETKVLRLLTGGLTNAEIGAALFISPKTASVHVSRLIRKLEVANRTEAATWAMRHGLTAET